MKLQPLNMSSMKPPMHNSGSSFFSANTQSTNQSNQVSIEKINYLESENKKLKTSNAQLQSEMGEMKDQNQHLKSLLQKNNIPFEDVKEENLTFVTQGSENPTVKCENCLKEIDKSKMRLHHAYCLKNIKKCQFCNIPCDGEKGFEQHISSTKGDYTSISIAIEENDLKKLLDIQMHMPKTQSFVDHFINPSNDNPIHHSINKIKDNVEHRQKMIDFFVANDIDINNQNKNGETPLHLAAKYGDTDLLKYLILKCNADINIKNNLGDSVMQCVQRSQNHDAIMILNDVNEQKKQCVIQGNRVGSKLSENRQYKGTPQKRSRSRVIIDAGNVGKPPLQQ